MRIQGYCDYSPGELSKHHFGNRFAYGLCSIILIIAVATASVPLLTIMLLIAFLGVVLPNHPFDYLFNYWLRKPLNKPKLPRRSAQLKFACTMATIFLAATIYAFYSGYMLAGYIIGSSLIFSAMLVATTDICIPSMIYNYLFGIKVEGRGPSS